MKDEFFYLDDGRSMLDESEVDTMSTNFHNPNTPLLRVGTFASARTSFSSETTRTIISERGGYGLPLEHLCRMISTHPSLQDAQIISLECYTKHMGPTLAGVVHRFLILQLVREGRKPVWLRMDCTRQKMTSTISFVRAGATSRANDTVSISSVY